MTSEIKSSTDSQLIDSRTIRPIAASSIHGIAFYGDYLLAVDAKNGYLLKIDPATDNTTILNPNNWQDFIGATGLAITEDTLWFTAGQNVYTYSLLEQVSRPRTFARLKYPINGIAVADKTVYITSQKSGDIVIFSRESAQEITRLYAPGIGIENITVKGEELWVSDNLEQTIYCLDRATGEIKFNLLTPFHSPTGLTFCHNSDKNEDILYVSYTYQEPYIRDNPNADPNHELLYRLRSFIHPLYFRNYPDQKFVLSNGYLVEMTYVEELSPLDNVTLDNLEWRIALPAETHRQKIRSVEAVGLPFNEEIVDGQRVAVFKFDQLTENTRYVFGWRAVLEVWSVKYRIKPADCENLPPLPSDFSDRYLIDNDDLAMDTDIIQNAAQEAIGRETNILRKIYSIRNYVYDHLTYGIKVHIDTPDIACVEVLPLVVNMLAYY